MKPWQNLAVILCIAMGIGSATTHTLIHWLKIRATYGGYHHYGPQDQKALTILHGSSLAYDGLDWGQISEILGGAIESWATPGSSPSEWEVQHQRSPQVNRAIIVISPYDLNEYFLCDFRADIVPLGRTIRDLQHCGSDPQLCKRILSQYPQMFVRKLFPTVGRSDWVMVGIRAKLSMLANDVASMDVDAAPKFGSTRTSEIVERVSDWPPARLQRRLVLMRRDFQGKQWFNGLKRMALVRLLDEAQKQGQVVMVVMPVSGIYQKEFLSLRAKQDFEDALTDIQHRSPPTRLIRLDHLAALDNDDMFYDLVHLNMYGQRIATIALLNQLRSPSSLP